ncbi:hypothetical protein [Sinorhizobium meliloti]|uniref:hypothetical protein n=1 Tax=Rhizobium meliloti TaxID=382 RepID=UPI00299E96B8
MYDDKHSGGEVARKFAKQVLQGCHRAKRTSYGYDVSAAHIMLHRAKTFDERISSIAVRILVAEGKIFPADTIGADMSADIRDRAGSV